MFKSLEDLGNFSIFFSRIFMKFEAKNLSPVAFHALTYAESVCRSNVLTRGGAVKLDSMWQHRLTRLVRDRYMYSIRITV